MMKKMFALLISMLLLLVVVGCSSGTDEKASGATKGKEGYTIGFSQGTMNHPYRVAMVEGNEQYFKENNPDVKVVVTDGENQSSKQVTDVESLLAQNIDALILSPLTEDALTPVAKVAMDKGIPVITLDRKVNTPVTLHIGANNKQMGVDAGKYLTEILSGKGNIIEIQGTAGASATEERHSGFEEAIAGTELNVISTQYADYLREPAMSYMEDMLQRFPKGEIQAVYAHNDEMALGAAKAIAAAGRADEIKIIGMDGMNIAIEAVKNGELAATFIYPTTAPEAAQYAYKIVTGNTEGLESEVILEAQRVDPTNVDEFIDKGI
ncbi:substrate-binding domain-containing protein [Bacillus sp. FJAT-50079]|uniref:substrate-binding domain-containing protein n=1 Tax=Bacillus sp. FJAT-50079 TaxID=2833577 RepID=UPI001BC9580D|nr:substrate-binding domain-containing protein [Bacillus sp. FJAT-50079]MBS4207526.1 substrate-binding domain-containing protein [Bacillus sp. FJAT-50079]